MAKSLKAKWWEGRRLKTGNWARGTMGLSDRGTTDCGPLDRGVRTTDHRTMGPGSSGPLMARMGADPVPEVRRQWSEISPLPVIRVHPCDPRSVPFPCVYHPLQFATRHRVLPSARGNEFPEPITPPQL